MVSDRSTSPISALPKSRQERIRDNQRRSRARSREYLADIERRLEEYQVACREAELQRVALADLQLENAHLRDLLTYVGINADVVERSCRQNISQHGVTEIAATQRQIRPKYQRPVPNNLSIPANPIRQNAPSELHCPTTATSSLSYAADTVLSTDTQSIYWPQHTTPFLARPSISSVMGNTPNSPYNWTQIGHQQALMDLTPM